MLDLQTGEECRGVVGGAVSVSGLAEVIVSLQWANSVWLVLR
jgi:hypothetical protein